ncbi:MAG: nuclear transport factor 2 family protein [Hyphomonadaceae bacterium]|nr:nuclear transport factor 2 family protein [Hyphomonadaceae bacterium]
MRTISPSEIVQAQLDAYNARDVELLLSFYADDCAFMDLAGNVTLGDRAAVRALFGKTFAQHPQNRAWSANRFSVGNIVVDHEIIEREPGGERIESAAIYVVKDGKIARLLMGRPD